MEDKSPKKYYDEGNGLWCHVHWDAEIKCFVWILAPHQKLIDENTPE